jgi:hypothetical protein
MKSIGGKAILASSNNVLPVISNKEYYDKTNDLKQKDIKQTVEPVSKEFTKKTINIDALIAMYPNSLAITNGDDLFVTPILLDSLDLNITLISKENFNESYNIITKILNNTLIDFSYTSDICYNTYLDIINNIEKNIGKHFVINLFFLLQCNYYENFFQKQLNYDATINSSNIINNRDNINNINTDNDSVIQKGGVNLWKQITDMGTKAVSIATDLKVILTNPSDYLIATGGSDILSETIGFMSTFATIEALNSLLGIDINVQTVLAMTIIVKSLGARQTLGLLNNVKDVTINNLPTCAKKILLSDTSYKLSSYMNFEGTIELMEKFNVKVTQTITNQVKLQYAAYTSDKYINSITKIDSISYETLKKNIIEFQKHENYLVPEFTDEINETVDVIDEPNLTDEQIKSFIVQTNNEEGQEIVNYTSEAVTALTPLNMGQRNIIKNRMIRLFPGQQKSIIAINKLFAQLPKAIPTPTTEKKEFKTFACPICDEKFSFFKDDGYIHQITNETNKDNTELEFQSKINIFPCKQLILSLTPEKKALPEYTFGSESDDKLMCSLCFLSGLNSLDPGTWPLYFGQKQDNTTISFELVKQLIIELSPIELETISKVSYNENRLSYCKFSQTNESETKIETEVKKLIEKNPTKEYPVARNEILNSKLRILGCPNCNISQLGRFYGVYSNSDKSLLYLHCNSCGINFNGCDFNAPYILNKKQFVDLLKKDDVCEFITQEKLKQQRVNGKVRVSLNKFKQLNEIEIRNKWSKKAQEMTSLNIKKCPRCERMNDLLAGCSAITCSECGQNYCYVCSAAIGGNRGHDSNHFLVNLTRPDNLDGCPLGGWFAIQCVNVNFTIIDPDNNRGINYGYKQTINGTLTDIKPSDSSHYKLLTRCTWKKYEYLFNKTKKLLAATRQPNSDVDVDGQLCSDAGIWPNLNSIYYNTELDEAYEPGDIKYDPDILVKDEIQNFNNDCNLGLYEPIVAASSIENKEDIEDYVDETGETGETGETDKKEDNVVDNDELLNIQLVRGLVNNNQVINQINDRLNDEDIAILQEILDIEEQHNNEGEDEQLQQFQDDEEVEIHRIIEEQLEIEREQERVIRERLEIEQQQNIAIERARQERFARERQQERIIRDRDREAIQELLDRQIQEEEQARNAAEQERINRQRIEQENQEQIDRNLQQQIDLALALNLAIDDQEPVNEERRIPENFQGLDLQEEERLLQNEINNVIEEEKRENQQKYDILVEFVEKKINNTNDEDDKNYYIRLKGQILEYKANNTILPRPVNSYLCELITVVNINKNIVNATNADIKQICVLKSIFGYEIYYKNSQNKFFILQPNGNLIEIFFVQINENLVCMDFNFANLKSLVEMYNNVVFGEPFRANLNEILLSNNQQVKIFVFESIPQIIGGHGGKVRRQTLKNKKILNKTTLKNKKILNKTTLKNYSKKTYKLNHNKKIKKSIKNIA